MDAVRSAKSLVKFYRATRRHIPEDSVIVTGCCALVFPASIFTYFVLLSLVDGGTR
jgi:hypothetical protein